MTRVREAAGLVDRCYVYDNSRPDGSRSLVMSIRKGQRPVEHCLIPAWAREIYQDWLRDSTRKD